MSTTKILGENTTLSPNFPSAEILADTANRLGRLEALGIGDETWRSLPRDEQFARLHAVVGDTPLQEVEVENGSVTVKRECDNPSGSHYDRLYLNTIEHFESLSFLKPGDELRDITSGSAGISLALIGYLLGYKVRITVPGELPANRTYPMQYFGAEVISSGAGYVPAASTRQTEEILQFRDKPEWVERRPSDRSGRSILFENESSRVCYLNHSENELSPIIFGDIAEELSQQAPDMTHLVLAEGNWTTIAGIAKRIRDLMPLVKVVSYSGEIVDGLTENFGTNVPDVPIRFKDGRLVDQQVVVRNLDRDQIRVYAPDLGRSSLMGLWVGRQIITQIPDAVVTTIGYDLSVRY